MDVCIFVANYLIVSVQPAFHSTPLIVIAAQCHTWSVGGVNIWYSIVIPAQDCSLALTWNTKNIFLVSDTIRRSSQFQSIYIYETCKLKYQQYLSNIYIYAHDKMQIRKKTWTQSTICSSYNEMQLKECFLCIKCDKLTIPFWLYNTRVSLCACALVLELFCGYIGG